MDDDKETGGIDYDSGDLRRKVSMLSDAALGEIREELLALMHETDGRIARATYDRNEASRRRANIVGGIDALDEYRTIRTATTRTRDHPPRRRVPRRNFRTSTQNFGSCPMAHGDS